VSILYIAVTYRTADQARAFASHFQGAPEGTHLVLVDNTEPEHRESLQVERRDSRSHATYVESPSNLGYFGGARLGLTQALEAGIRPQWLVVSNVDIRFSPADVAGVLAEQDSSQVGVVAPSIRSSLSGRELNPFMANRPGRLRMRAYRYVFWPYWGLVAYTAASQFASHLGVNRRHEAEGVAEPRAVYAAHGSFMIFSSEFFLRGGDLSHAPFLFFEEITIAERVRRLNLPILFAPKLRVVHEEHASTSRLPGRLHHRFVREALVHVTDSYF
jgi:GT2 family glycosyltransferase